MQILLLRVKKALKKKKKKSYTKDEPSLQRLMASIHLMENKPNLIIIDDLSSYARDKKLCLRTHAFIFEALNYLKQRYFFFFVCVFLSFFSFSFFFLYFYFLFLDGSCLNNSDHATLILSDNTSDYGFSPKKSDKQPHIPLLFQIICKN